MGAWFWGVLEGGLRQGSGCSPPPGVTCKVCKNRCSISGSLAGPGIQPLVVGRQETPGLGRGTRGLCVPLNKHPPNSCLSSFWPVDFLRNFFSQTLGLGTQKERLLDELTLEGVSRYMQSERCEFPTLGPFLRDSPPPPLLLMTSQPQTIHSLRLQVTRNPTQTVWCQKGSVLIL